MGSSLRNSSCASQSSRLIVHGHFGLVFKVKGGVVVRNAEVMVGLVWL